MLNNTQRFYEIDFLRFMSAFMVMIFHYTFTGYMEGFTPDVSFEILRPVTRYFYMGINFFFVISGFVILMSATDASPRKFVTSRFIRLFPAYWFALLLTSFLIILFGGTHFTVTATQFAANITMLNPAFGILPIDGVYWTLFIELTFYLFILIFLFLGWMKYIQHAIAATLIISLFGLFYPPFLTLDPWVCLFPHWGGYFACGCTFYLLRRNGINPYLSILLLLSFVFVITQSVVFGQLMQGWFNIDFYAWVIALMNAVFFAVFYLIAINKCSLLQRPGFYALGVLTYPFYLIHQNIGYMSFNLLGHSINYYVLLILNAAAMLFVAYWIHHGIEKRFSPLLKKWLS